MNSHLLVNAGAAYIIYLLLFDLILVILLCSALVLLESIVLRIVKWGSFWRCLVASLLMNPVSTALGFGLLFMAPVSSAMGSGFVFTFPSLVSYSSWLELGLFLLISYLFSIAIEGGVLVLMKRHGGRNNWIAAFVANTASYALLIVPLAILLGAMRIQR